MNLTAIVLDGVRAALGVPAAAYALAAIGINIQFGYTGLLNFGQAGFLLAGAYGTAIAASRGVPLPLAFLCGLAAAALLGLALGLPTLRLRADFLAIVTISVAEILRLTFRARQLEPITGGVQGIQGFAEPFFAWNPIPPGRYGIGGLTFDQRQLWVLLWGWALVVGATLFVRRLVDSPWGRVVKAVRVDDDAPRAVGKDVFAYKVQSLVTGGVIGGAAGILIAVDAQYTNPEAWPASLTFYAYAALIAGGIATSWGPAVGAMVLWFVIQALDTFLRQAIDAHWLTFLEPTDTGPVRFMLVGLALMVLMVFRPQGILGRRDDVRAIER